MMITNQLNLVKHREKHNTCNRSRAASKYSHLSTTVVLISIFSTFILTFLGECISRFATECKIRNDLIERDDHTLTHILNTRDRLTEITEPHNLLDAATENKQAIKSIQLPSLRLLTGKRVPTSSYTAKSFDVVSVATVTSNTVHLDVRDSDIIESRDVNFRHGSSESFPHAGSTMCCLPRSEYLIANLQNRGVSSYIPDFSDEEKGELHYPSGQHLLVDMRNVDTDFLDSEQKLAHAMVELVNESMATLLSYHCHSLVPCGVSCAGVLLESHITIHTWPLEGVILLDLFTCGSTPLVPILPIIEKLFGTPRVLEPDADPQNITEPIFLWIHKLRGFRESFSQKPKKNLSPLERDLGLEVLSKRVLTSKQLLVSKETKYQRVDIYEVIDSRFQPKYSSDGSHESLYPELYSKDKLIFLDGVLQSSLYGETAYHEALVHPAMITHPNPKRVVIVGGGEGATLREVLKHKTVEKAIMLEIDKENVDVLKMFLPEWSNCSDFSDFDSCFDDPRADVRFQDAFQWFIDNFALETKNDPDTTHARENKEEAFDVIIMDALDPNDETDFAVDLYNNTYFIQSLSRGLTDHGVLVVQLGQSPSQSQPADEEHTFKVRATMMKMLKHVGFRSMHVYEEGHSRFGAPWSYLVALKDYTSRANWYRNVADIDIQLQKRMRKTKSGDCILKHFDAPTMSSYQIPPKVFETNICREIGRSGECLDVYNSYQAKFYLPADALVVNKSSVGEHAGRGLFAAQDIPADSSIAIDESSLSFHVQPATWSEIKAMHLTFLNNDILKDVSKSINALYTFIDGYGYRTSLLGQTEVSVDSNHLLFSNHGCNNTYNYGEYYSPTTEMSVDISRIPLEYNSEAEVFSPVQERHLRLLISGPEHTLRTIKSGEEVLTNYLHFLSDPTDWRESVLDLQQQCTGNKVGEITLYELGM